MTRPSKKTSTVDELRGMLGDMGLETKGKRETLWKRLLGHFKRSSPLPLPISASVLEKPTDNTAQTTQEVHPAEPEGTAEAAGEAGLSAKKWGKQPIRAFLCFNVEATCRGGKEFDWPNEIIEFPVVLLRWAEDVEGEELRDEREEDGQPEAGPSKASNGGPRLVNVDEFHPYVRPVWSPVLSEFCTRFTAITQEMVDASPTFPEVLGKLEVWLDSHGLRTIKGGDVVEGLVDAVWVTDGPWGLTQAFQTVLSEEYRRDQYALSHSNQAPNERSQSQITTGKLVGKVGEEKIKGLGFYLTIPGMLTKLGLGEFEGRQHCGLDDANNVARILQALVERDILVEANGRLPLPKNAKEWAWMGKPGELHWEEWVSDAKRPVVPASTPSSVPVQVAVPVATDLESAETKDEVQETKAREEEDKLAETSPEGKPTNAEQPGEEGEFPKLVKEDEARGVEPVKEGPQLELGTVIGKDNDLVLNIKA